MRSLPKSLSLPHQSQQEIVISQKTYFERDYIRAYDTLFIFRQNEKAGDHIISKRGI